MADIIILPDCLPLYSRDATNWLIICVSRYSKLGYHTPDIHLSPDCVRFFWKDVLEIPELNSNLIIGNLYRGL
ncbi:hypothetical protein J4462_04865 [Candidatus Pacearchaeota archaeon]|nr:hypothetical protein [Candidatus Pacearchaeota archaeon]